MSDQWHSKNSLATAALRGEHTQRKKKNNWISLMLLIMNGDWQYEIAFNRSKEKVDTLEVFNVL